MSESKLMCFCSRCGQQAHGPESCPAVTAIEYHENGKIKRIEYQSNVSDAVSSGHTTIRRLSDGKTIELGPVERPPTPEELERLKQAWAKLNQGFNVQPTLSGDEPDTKSQ